MELRRFFLEGVELALPGSWMFRASGILLRKRGLTRGRPEGAKELAAGVGGEGGGVSMITSGSWKDQSRCCSSPSSIDARMGVSGRGLMVFVPMVMSVTASVKE